MTKDVRKILFIVIDQLRADCVQGALADAIDLPNLRALMADGVTFGRHYTVTTPCGPARASLLTSLYAMNHRSVRNGTPLDGTLDTLPKALRGAGVEPLLFGYTDTSADPRGRDPADPALRTYEGVMPGFTELLVMQEDTCHPWAASLLAKGYKLPPVFRDIYRPAPPMRPAALTRQVRLAAVTEPVVPAVPAAPVAPAAIDGSGDVSCRGQRHGVSDRSGDPGAVDPAARKLVRPCQLHPPAPPFRRTGAL